MLFGDIKRSGKMKKKAILISIFVSTLLAGASVFAQNSSGYLIFQEHEMEELRRLQNDDPQEFKRYLNERRQKVRQGLEELRTDNPEEYNRRIGNRKSSVYTRLEQFYKTDPENARKFLQQHRQHEMNRLQTLKQANPQKFKKELKRHQSAFNRKLERIKERNPLRYDRIQQSRDERRQQRRNELDPSSGMSPYDLQKPNRVDSQERSIDPNRQGKFQDRQKLENIQDRPNHLDHKEQLKERYKQDKDGFPERPYRQDRKEQIQGEQKLHREDHQEGQKPRNKHLQDRSSYRNLENKRSGQQFKNKSRDFRKPNDRKHIKPRKPAQRDLNKSGVLKRQKKRPEKNRR